jgi:hypothetical protein
LVPFHFEIFFGRIFISSGCSNPDYVYGPTALANCAFATDLMELMDGEKIQLWGYGHTHWFHDMTFNGTRVVSNPHGYPSREDIQNYSAQEDPKNSYQDDFVVYI